MHWMESLLPFIDPQLNILKTKSVKIAYMVTLRRQDPRPPRAVNAMASRPVRLSCPPPDVRVFVSIEVKKGCGDFVGGIFVVRFFRTDKLLE